MNENINYQKIGRKIPQKQVIAYGFMVGSLNIIGVARNMYLFAYLIDVFGLQLELFLFANLLFFSYNALNDILFGIHADRTRHKLGRRIPYIRYGSLFLILTNILIWFPWPGTHPGDANEGEFMKFMQYVVFLFVSDTVSTIVLVSFNAWLPEATESEEERTQLSLIGSLGNILGGLYVPILPFIYNAGLDMFRIYLIIANTVSALCFFAGSFIIKERPELYNDSFKNATTKDIFKQFVNLYKRKSFLSSVIFGFSTMMMGMFMINYSKLIGYSLGFESGELIVSGIFYVSHFTTLPVLNRMVKSRPVEKVIVKVIKPGLVLLVIFYIAMVISGFSWFIIPILVLGGIMSSVSLYGAVISSNVIDQDELESGQRQEALFGAAYALVNIPMSQFLGSFVAIGLIIFNYQEGVGFDQEPSALFGIRFLFFIILFIGGIFALICMKIYPFKGEALVKLKEDIIALHARKEAIANSNQESFSTNEREDHD